VNNLKLESFKSYTINHHRTAVPVGFIIAGVATLLHFLPTNLMAEITNTT